MKRIREFLKANKVSFMVACMMAITSVMSFAVDDATFDLTTLMTTSAQSIVSNLLKMVSAILPIMITLFAASVGIKYGMRFLKSITSKSN